MNYSRRLKMHFMNHKGKIFVALFIVGVLFFTVWGLSSLESFYRNMTLATIPVQIFVGMIHAVVFVYMYMVVLRGGVSKMTKKNIQGKKVNVKFDDVIGIDEAKDEAFEVVQLVKDHAKIQSIGGKIVKGILMIGPPGCGKTFLAKAIASEAGLPFLSIAGSEFNEVFVGVGSSRVRQLFKKARSLAYGYGGCVIFIDEIDVIGHKRVFNQFGGNESNTTQNQLLAEMDGVDSAGDNVIVIGATNASEESLDTAMLRPGRFDRKVHISKPNLEGRKLIFEHYLNKVKHSPSIDCSVLAKKAVGKSPAEIEAIIKESALIATRKMQELVTYKEISEAIERIELGMKVKTRMNDKEREMTAYHEAGHLIVLFLLHPTDDVFKASIIPRRSSLGVVHHQPREEWHCSDRNKILTDIKVALAGYCSEKLQYGVTTNGVSSDFKAAMYYAHMMVWMIGMSDDEYVGDFSAIPKDQLSEEWKKKLNDQTNTLLQSCLKEVDELLKTNKNILDRFVKELLEKEELEYDEIEAIFGEFGIKNPRQTEVEKETETVSSAQSEETTASEQDAEKEAE